MKTIPYGRQFIDSTDIKEVLKTLKSNWITQGPKINEFEGALCKYAGVKYAVVVSNGTAALHIACLAAEIKRGDEVITSPITFVASANCVLYCGAKPVFADIQEDTVNIDPEAIKRKISQKTKAIIPVHFAGHPCELKEIHSIAKKHNLTVIEDAAHALGAEYKGSKIGSCKYSDMTIFSFHPVKHITTGEGGAVLTNRKDLYEKLLMFRNHGITKNSSAFRIPHSAFVGSWYYEMQELGFNYRITDIQCALGISQLKKLDKFIERRREIVRIYQKAFSNNRLFNLPAEKKHAESSWHLYVIKLKDKYRNERKQIFERLRNKGLGVQVHYIPVYLQPYYIKLGYRKGLCPKAEEYYKGVITLPLYPKMSISNVKRVIHITKSVIRKFKK
ncbi:MAG: UDP-4-amino-4,6-dideoxy-N-acetyl-beta-L-altrosamine transaminase [Elusimicrobia bacterium]|nr:UDP-4-amino-4,6-dideoxy-N-acetyl-beta-L-altrosamine transaminase [Elusimicrobiota bacterium]